MNNLSLSKSIHLLKKNQIKDQEFFAALYQARLLCPIEVDSKNLHKNGHGRVVLNEDVAVSLVSLSDSSGRKCLVGFTDRNELGKWPEGKQHQTIIYTYDEYKKLIMAERSPYQGVVINPFSDNVFLPKKVFSNGQPDAVTMHGKETLMIGLPKEYPAIMVEKLKEYFKKTKQVELAYLLWKADSQGTGYLLVLGMKVSPDKLFPQVGEICRPFLKDITLDMLPLNTEFGQRVVKGYQPFYSIKSE